MPEWKKLEGSDKETIEGRIKELEVQGYHRSNSDLVVGADAVEIFTKAEGTYVTYKARSLNTFQILSRDGTVILGQFTNYNNFQNASFGNFTSDDCILLVLNEGEDLREFNVGLLST